VALSSPAIDVAAPADPVMLPARTANELTAATQAALDNVRRHAGPGAPVWILLEPEGDGVRVTVSDDGVGVGPDRLTEAAVGNRLGVAQSMKGRITDLGGTTTIHSAPTRAPRWSSGSPPRDNLNLPGDRTENGLAGGEEPRRLHAVR
jgi:signal transduction histidine kinase